MPQTTTLDPQCAGCEKPMTWHSVHAIGSQQVNVFERKACDKISALPARTPGIMAMRT